MEIFTNSDMEVKNKKNIHCLVHPGFDTLEHPEYESRIHEYIESIAFKTNDILLIVSDGEDLDNQQLEQFAYMDTLRAISVFLSLQKGGLSDLINIYDEEGIYNQIIAQEGLTESFYQWCFKNIDVSELQNIADGFRKLQNDYFVGKYQGDRKSHDVQVDVLNEREEKYKSELDVKSILNEAIQDFGPAFRRGSTTRNISNRGRFFRIYQHAIQVLGTERVKEIFIADGERPDRLAINPVSHFQTLTGEMVATPLGYNAQIYNATEMRDLGNAALLNDEITYNLSLSRHKKLAEQQPEQILDKMGIEVDSDTIFTFAGEYRNKCVNSVASVLNHRLDNVPSSNFIIAPDAFTLERPY